MKKMMKIICAFAASTVIALSSSIVACADDTGYTYNYDWWGDVQFSPDAYNVAGVFTTVELGLDKKLNMPAGLFIYERTVYICDTGNNRIVELERTDVDKFELRRIIESFKGGKGPNTLAGPTDMAVTEDGYMYICDKNNGRILKLDMDLNYVMEFTKPSDPNFDQSLSFLPHKLIVDDAGRVYCIATNVNKGLIKFEADGEFSGFIGATKVTYDWTDYIWKKIATKEQREQMESFVPTEYDSIYVDHDGFIYAVTSNVAEADLDAGTADPIRRLNLLGNDILVRNGPWYILGDLYWGEGGGYDGPSRMTDITAFDNDVYVALDRTRGRLFFYDDQGRMLWAFGGNGNEDGYFKSPIALDHMGFDLVVLDTLDCSITLFTPTEFGSLVYKAIGEFQAGKYTEAGETWQEALKLNGNYDLAYIGIGRSLLRQERYHEAMEYFELKFDADNYSKAFKQYRKQWVEENILFIVLGLVLVLCVPLAIGKVKKIKHEIDIADIFRR